MGPRSGSSFDEVLLCMAGNETEQSTHHEIGHVSFVITNGFPYRLTRCFYSVHPFYWGVCVCVCMCVCVSVCVCMYVGV